MNALYSVLESNRDTLRSPKIEKIEEFRKNELHECFGEGFYISNLFSEKMNFSIFRDFSGVQNLVVFYS